MQSTCLLQKEQLERLAQDTSKTVLVEQHDIVFEPWPTKRIRSCIDQLIQLTYKPELDLDKKKIREESKNKIELVKFSNYHHTLYERFTDPEYAHNDKFVKGIEMMLKIKEKTETGDIEEGEEADKKVAESLMKAFHNPEQK